MEGRNKNYRLFLMTIMLIMLADNVFGDFSMNSAGAEYRIPNLFLHNFINRINEQQESPMNPMDMILTNKDSIESNNYMYPDSSVSIQVKQKKILIGFQLIEFIS